MTYSYTFKWSDPTPGSVKVTGSFNDWQEQLPLSKTADGYELNVKLVNNSKVLFKFVVDGEWCISSEYLVANDNGIENNFVDSDDLHIFEEFEKEPSADTTPEVSVVGVSGGGAAGSTDSNGTGATGTDAPTSTADKEAEDGTQEIHSVITSNSSFAAVSIPSDKFEEIEPSTMREISENLSDSTSTLNHKSKEVSKDELRMPGTYPVGSSSTVSASGGGNEDTPTKRRENLISRFRGLFKY